MNKSEQINELAAALSKAQGEMRHAEKNCVNPHFKNRFADLSSIWDAIREPLSKNGLSIVQCVDAMEGRGQVLVTVLMHSSGQWINSIMPLLMSKQDSQGLGSSLTYAKRYALSALIGVSSDDDDDGEAAVGRDKSTQKQQNKNIENKVVETPTSLDSKVSEDQLKVVLDEFSKTEKVFQDNSIKYTKEQWKVGSVEEFKNLTEKQAYQLLGWIKNNLSKIKTEKGE